MLEGDLDLSQHYPRHPSTCEWVTAAEGYQDWLVNKPSILHLHGAMGCGKSTLLGYIAETLSSNDTTATMSDIILVRYAFQKTITGRRSIHGFLLRLIRQILFHMPSLFLGLPQLLPDDLEWSLPRLWDMFRSLLVNPTRPDVICLIDDIDTCGSSGESLLSHITAEIDTWLTADTPRRGCLAKFKLVVTSGSCGVDISPHTNCNETIPCMGVPYSHHCISVETERGLHDDKRSIVTSRTEQILRKRVSLGRYREFIIERLSSHRVTILQAVSNLRILDEYGPGVTPLVIATYMSTFPRSLDHCYCRLLENIPLECQKVAAKAFSWILYAARPLTLHELAAAVSIKPYGSPPFDEKLVRTDLIEDIGTVLGPLVLVTGNRVDFFHSSVREFLLRRVNAYDPLDLRQPMILTVLTTGKDVLAQSCLAYLHWSLSGARVHTRHTKPEPFRSTAGLGIHIASPSLLERSSRLFESSGSPEPDPVVNQQSLIGIAQSNLLSEIEKNCFFEYALMVSLSKFSPSLVLYLQKQVFNVSFT